MAQPVRPRISEATQSVANSDHTQAVTLAAANDKRTAFMVHNNSTATLYLKLGSAASSTSFTKVLLTQTDWELPTTNGVYSGIITGRWAATNGDAQVTEY